ncbi:MAG TPA: DoxX family protein [Candidatus Angelobacter sp.]|jgi:putative oxidoreductase|nr:DoxX family protein [Candidatus Angelobacter sp.]
MKFLSKFEGIAYALMRIVVGLLFACHGAQKLFGVLGGQSMVHVPLMLVAGIIEFGGGLLVALGFFTRLAAFICSGQMAVAYFTAHFHLHGSYIPIINQGEPAVIYCFVFLFISTYGPGKWAIEKK